MEITMEFSSVSRVKYQFNEWEIEHALVEFVERYHAERLLEGGGWSFEWWPGEENDDGRLGLMGELTQAVTQED